MLLTILTLINSLLIVLGLALIWQVKKSQPELKQDYTNQRQELTLTLKSFGDGLEARLDKLTALVGERLETMRQTVDEKLQTSLDRRLKESFSQVSERLEMVYKGLGEMQTLASGVGDLKRVLTNVKTRGTWGEVQLDNLLAQFLAQSNYEQNVVTKVGSRERVEFAIRIPSKERGREVILLPIDAKFPLEDYQRLQIASEQADAAAVAAARQALELRLKKCAKDIHDKYLDPPHTTEFALLYLPLEGLYAEVAQNQAWCETLQRQYHVTVVGPNTVTAFLNSLQLGFRTLTIEKRSSEVWQILGQIQTDFDRFGELLTKTQKKLQEASNVLDEAQTKTRGISKRLARVDQVPQISTAEEQL